MFIRSIERHLFGEHAFSLIAFSEKGMDKHVNQDSVRLFADKERVIAVLADGLGSAASSDVGSQIGCEVCLNLLMTTKPQEPSFFSELVRRWVEALPGNPNDYDTTLRFVIIESKRVTWGGVGDGWTAVLIGDTYAASLASNSFSNQTDSLLSICEPSPFFLESLPISKESIMVCLSTDGFSEDFEIERGEPFLRDVSRGMKEDLSGFTKSMESILEKWPIETNGDDKSVIFVQGDAL